MTSEEAVKRAHVKDDVITIVCPSCHINKTVPVASLKGRTHAVEIRCKCGYSFPLQMEFRKYPRRKTSLVGDYTLEKPSNQEAGHTKVINLSIQGACFEVRGLHDITPNMEGELVFILDNKDRTLLFRRVIIRSVRGSLIGCEFLDSGNARDDLEDYIRGEER